MSSENEDPSQKTEEPTAYKLKEAEKKGEFAISKEVGHLFALFAMTGVVWVASPYLTTSMAGIFKTWMSESYQVPMDGPSLHRALISIFWECFKIIIFPLALFIIAAVLSTAVQTRLKMNTKALVPKLSNLSLMKGWERLFSGKALMDFLKNVLRLGAIGTLCFFIFQPYFHRLDALTGIGMQAVMGALSDFILTLLLWICCAIFFFAVIDYGFQYFMHLKKMRMSHQEIKEEYKQTEGDPHIKSRIKQLRYQQHQRQTLKSIEDATVLITNPTHFAVALKWEESNMSAPVVVAKGVDFLALRMREVAKHHDIPIVENPPLARSLYSNLKISQEIKPEYYKAIAEVIRFVLGITKGAYYAKESIEEARD